MADENGNLLESCTNGQNSLFNNSNLCITQVDSNKICTSFLPSLAFINAGQYTNLTTAFIPRKKRECRNHRQHYWNHMLTTLHSIIEEVHAICEDDERQSDCAQVIAILKQAMDSFCLLLQQLQLKAVQKTTQDMQQTPCALDIIGGLTTGQTTVVPIVFSDNLSECVLVQQSLSSNTHPISTATSQVINTVVNNDKTLVTGDKVIADDLRKDATIVNNIDTLITVNEIDNLNSVILDTDCAINNLDIITSINLRSNDVDITNDVATNSNINIDAIDCVHDHIISDISNDESATNDIISKKPGDISATEGIICMIKDKEILSVKAKCLTDEPNQGCSNADGITQVSITDVHNQQISDKSPMCNNSSTWADKVRSSNGQDSVKKTILGQTTKCSTSINKRVLSTNQSKQDQGLSKNSCGISEQQQRKKCNKTFYRSSYHSRRTPELPSNTTFINAYHVFHDKLSMPNVANVSERRKPVTSQRTKSLTSKLSSTTSNGNNSCELIVGCKNVRSVQQGKSQKASKLGGNSETRSGELLGNNTASMSSGECSSDGGAWEVVSYHSSQYKRQASDQNSKITTGDVGSLDFFDDMFTSNMSSSVCSVPAQSLIHVSGESLDKEKSKTNLSTAKVVSVGKDERKTGKTDAKDGDKQRHHCSKSESNLCKSVSKSITATASAVGKKVSGHVKGGAISAVNSITGNVRKQHGKGKNLGNTRTGGVVHKSAEVLHSMSTTAINYQDDSKNTFSVFDIRAFNKRSLEALFGISTSSDSTHRIKFLYDDDEEEHISQSLEFLDQELAVMENTESVLTTELVTAQAEEENYRKLIEDEEKAEKSSSESLPVLHEGHHDTSKENKILNVKNELSLCFDAEADEKRSKLQNEGLTMEIVNWVHCGDNSEERLNKVKGDDDGCAKNETLTVVTDDSKLCVTSATTPKLFATSADKPSPNSPSHTKRNSLVALTSISHQPQSIEKIEEKQAKAKEQREKMLLERQEKVRDLTRRVEEAQQQRITLMEVKKECIEMKLQRANEKRSQQLASKVRKAHDEELKGKEIAFIQSFDQEQKQHMIQTKNQEFEVRLAELQEERKRKMGEKADREAAVEERRKSLARDRTVWLASVQERWREREQQLMMRAQVEDESRREKARVRELQREERLAALKVQGALRAEQLKSKIQKKQEDTEKRYIEQLREISRRAFEMSVMKHSAGDCDDAPPLVPYDKKKWCLACNIMIYSEVTLQSHLRGKKHQHAVSEKYQNRVLGKQELETFNLKNIVDASSDEVDPKLQADKERYKNQKKRIKRLKSRTTARGLEFLKMCFELSSPSPVTSSTKDNNNSNNNNNFDENSLANLFRASDAMKCNKSVIVKFIRDVGKCFSVTEIGPWVQRRVASLDKAFGALIRVMEKPVRDDQLCFMRAGGFPVLVTVLKLLEYQKLDTVPILPDKSFYLAILMFEFACCGNAHVSTYVLYTNYITVLVDCLANRLKQLPYDFLDIICVSLLRALYSVLSALKCILTEHHHVTVDSKRVMTPAIDELRVDSSTGDSLLQSNSAVRIGTPEPGISSNDRSIGGVVLSSSSVGVSGTKKGHSKPTRGGEHGGKTVGVEITKEETATRSQDNKTTTSAGMSGMEQFSICLQDLVIYIVSLGIVDRLTKYFIHVRQIANSNDDTSVLSMVINSISGVMVTNNVSSSIMFSDEAFTAEQQQNDGGNRSPIKSSAQSIFGTLKFLEILLELTYLKFVFDGHKCNTPSDKSFTSFNDILSAPCSTEITANIHESSSTTTAVTTNNNNHTVMNMCHRDCTHLLETVRATEIFGLISMLYGLLLHNASSSNTYSLDNDACGVMVTASGDCSVLSSSNSAQQLSAAKASRTSHESGVICVSSMSISVASLQLINTLAAHDIDLVQSVLGEETTSLQLRHTLSFLMNYCCQQLRSNNNTADVMLSMVTLMLNEIIVCVGHFALGNLDNQICIQSGHMPTILQMLCQLPFAYFSDPTLTLVLYPTLVACCYGNLKNTEIVQQELNTSLLCQFIESNIAKDEELTTTTSNSTSALRTCFAARFPKLEWQKALDFFKR